MTGPRTLVLERADAVALAEMLGLFSELGQWAPNGIALSLWVCELDLRYPLEELCADLARMKTKVGGGA